MVQRDGYIMLLAVITISGFADVVFGLRCNQIDYMGYNKRCCQQTIIESYDTSPTAPLCNNGQPIDPKFPAMFMDYTINKYQNCSNDYKIDWNNSRVIEELGQTVCFGDCGFGFLHLLNSDGTVNDFALSILVPTLAPLQWKLTMLEAIGKCKEPTNLLKDVKLTVVDATTGASKSCAVTPYVFIQCVMGYVIGRCPTDLQLSVLPDSCTTDIAKIDKCTSIFNLPPLSG